MGQLLKSNLLSEPARGLICLLIAGLWLAGCSGPPQRALLGTWKSAADPTLESMRETDDIPAVMRQRFEADYYGHLVIEYRQETVRAYFDNSDYDSGYVPYEVLSVDADRIVTREWNEIFGVFELSSTWFAGDCIYGLSAEYAFREYFCRVD